MGEFLESIRTEDCPLGSVPAEVRLLNSRSFVGTFSSSHISVTVALYLLLALLVHENVVNNEDNMRTRQFVPIAGPGLFPPL